MKRTHLITLSLVLVILIGFSWARKPAVEPIKGISIDEFKPVIPANARGFDFTSGKAKTIAPDKSSTNQFPWPLLILFALFPMGISLIIVKRIKKPKHIQEAKKPINLDDHRKKKDSTKEWKEAS